MSRFARKGENSGERRREELGSQRWVRETSNFSSNASHENLGSELQFQVARRN
ncbi:hypothetical protein K0M31_014508, partial [Melipona bicolor]